ncbi:LysR family transcriptional regulator [Bradyrhizobium elkanii]|uniref:LysR family transcriptional regulator n=1 Tax=Bradyrhizobium elkanii TaxID=29448 RepID=UPI0004AEA822|nr:LysR family transcriptional regulator [Bradyrhizobium elkanii]WLA81535.1 LysR family transcriptional regulator [Bradyrhizobium elkanii]
MDYRQLRYFIAVAEELSFSRAAKRLHVSQPPLSTQIKAMEEELGTRLLARTRRAVELTQAGQLLLEHARRAVSELDLASETVRRAARGEAGMIRVGFTGSVPMLDMLLLHRSASGAGARLCRVLARDGHWRATTAATPIHR